MITAMTPMTMPRTARVERSLFAASAERATLNARRKNMLRAPQGGTEGRRRSRAGLLDPFDPAVPQVEDPVGMERHRAVVRHQHDGNALLRQPLEDLEDLLARLGVEVAGR